MESFHQGNMIEQMTDDHMKKLRIGLKISNWSGGGAKRTLFYCSDGLNGRSKLAPFALAAGLFAAMAALRL